MAKVGSVVRIFSLVVAGLVALLAALAALRQHDLGPLETLGWVPAVIAASVWNPTRGCGHGWRGRRQAGA